MTDSSGIYRVIDIQPGTDYKGNNCPMVSYEPVWGTDKKYTATIPLKNIKGTGLRCVFSSKEVKTTIARLAMASEEVFVNYNSNEAKEVMYQNDLDKIIPLLQFLWLNQTTLKKNDKDLMEQILENLAREMAFVTKSKLNKVKEEITGSLNKIAH